MRKVTSGVLLLVLAISAGIFLASSASGQTVLHVVSGPQEDMRVVAFDENHDGLRLGDRIAGRGPLLDEAHAERVGTAFVDCIVARRILDPDRGVWNCNYVLELADGDVMLQGLDPRGPGVYEMAVIGGTGSYAGATGEATFTDAGPDQDAYTDMVITLR